MSAPPAPGRSTSLARAPGAHGCPCEGRRKRGYQAPRVIPACEGGSGRSRGRRPAKLLWLEPPVPLASTHHPLARHAQHRLLVGQGAEPHGRDPREGMRFFADPDSVVLGLNEESVRRIGSGLARGHGPESCARRCQRWRRRAPARRVRTPRALRAARPRGYRGLRRCDHRGCSQRPSLAIVRQEHAVARHVHDPRRARDVADPAGTVESCRGTQSTKASKRATVAASCGHRSAVRSARSAFSPRRCIGPGPGERPSP